MKHVIIGTAGHVDHGKTALVRALTGVDTDRLAEEKRRGLTIELGFARLDFPDGSCAGVVDVPGHEKFIKTMLAGAGGIDLCIGGVALHHGVGAGFVDDARRDEFFLLRVLDVTQAEQDAAALSRGQLYMYVQRTNRSPAMGDAAGAMACPNGLRVCRAAIYAAECITGGVKAADGAVGPENSVMVTALTVFGLMIDSAALHLDFTGGEIALEVGAVVHSVPQAELHIAEHIQLFIPATLRSCFSASSGLSQKSGASVRACSSSSSMSLSSMAR